MAASACLATAACGSSLSPDEVHSLAAGTAGGTGGGSTGTDAGSGSVGTDTGTGSTSVDSGSGSGLSTADGQSGSATGSGSGTGSGTSSGSGQSGGGSQPAPSTKTVSCEGLQDGPGVSADTITVGNAADISGPIPGLLQTAQDAAKAFIAYFNATSDLCGRKLKLVTYDTRTDSAGDQQAYTKACTEVFAMVGSVGSYDLGGADATQKCGLPDIRSVVVSPQRAACTTCFAAMATRPDQIPRGHIEYIRKIDPNAVKHIAEVWVDVPAAEANARNSIAADEKLGGTVVSKIAIPATEFNYAPYVQQMKDKGVQYIRYWGPEQFTIRLLQAMQQQNWKIPAFLVGPGAYTAKFLEQAGDAAEGMLVWMYNDTYDSTNPEMKLYLSWLNQVHPGAAPDYFGFFAWSATRLAVEKMAALGGKLTRQTLIDAVSKEHHWDDFGAHTPMDVGGRETSGCLKYLRVVNGAWKQISPGAYTCNGIVNVG